MYTSFGRDRVVMPRRTTGSSRRLRDRPPSSRAIPLGAAGLGDGRRRPLQPPGEPLARGGQDAGLFGGFDDAVADHGLDHAQRRC